MTEARWQRAKSWVGAEFEDSLVMVEVDLGTYVGLNDTAAAMWEAIEHPATRDEIIALLRTRFDVREEQCATAVDVTLERFREVGMAVMV